MRNPLHTRSLGSAVAALLALAACAGDNETHPADATAYDAGPSAALACVPNLDGKIEANELQAAIGVPARYLVSAAGKSRTVDLVGKVDAEGRRVWDMSATSLDDQAAVIRAQAIDGKWYAASFPGAKFVAPFDAGDAIEAIYSSDAHAIYLLGLASTTADPPEGRTLYVYDAPIALYRFPLAAGVHYTQTGKATNATLRGLPFAATDTYDVSVDAAGTVILPELTFTQALRVRTQLTISPAVGKVTTQRQVSFFFECFGEVARATSANDEPTDDFSTAVEIRRLGLPRQ